MGGAEAGKQQAQVIVDLGRGADGGAGVAVDGLLIDGERGRESVDAIDAGALHLAEKLPGILREALDKPSLALLIDGVEGQRGLARAARTGDDMERVLSQIQVKALQIVFAGAPDREGVRHGGACIADRG